MIITCKKDVPFRWIAFAILPWASFVLNGQVVAVAFFFSLKKFVENPAGLLDRELWPVYMLVVGAACLNFYAGLGPLSNLLYTEQWGYTKQEMGINVAVGGIINLFAIGMLVVSGLACLLIGAFLLYWSNKPIELPHIAPQRP